MKAIIGYTGTIGKHLCEQIVFDDFYNSKNINEIHNKTYQLLIIAAPSGNRLRINRQEEKDKVDELMEHLKHCSADKIVLISSVDAVLNPDSIYGKNRKILEDFVNNNFNATILRLATLIGTGIKKNIAYDLKHQQYNFINTQSTLQWSLLRTLGTHIDKTGIVNLVSEPILNKDIVDTFFPNLKLKECNASHQYKMKPYLYTKQEVLSEIERYLK